MAQEQTKTAKNKGSRRLNNVPGERLVAFV
nr:MAG TPA: hypothetical protein [Caudoviricetes sp.]